MSSRVRSWFLGALAFSVLAMLTVGCGGSSTPSGVDPDDENPSQPDDPDPSDPQDPGDPDSPFECERAAYPCSWSEVDPSIYEESVDLGHQLFGMLEGGQTMAQTLTWLDSRDEVVDAIGSDVAVRFRLDGGRPTWVFGPGVIQTFDGAPPSPPATVSSPAAAQEHPARSVVGDEPKSKRALVLSPYKWEFAGWDEGAQVAAFLGGLRDYEGNVDYFENTEPRARDVTPQQFEGWDAYDVVHVSTHGTQICEGDDCFTAIVAGEAVQELVLSSPEQGTDVVITGLEPQSSEDVTRSVGLTTEWFSRRYPGGLSDTIVFLSACQTSLGNDLESALTGQGSAFLGWTDSVWPDTAWAAALAFYEQLSEKGISATAAYGELGELTVDRPVPAGTIAVLSIHPGTEASPRVREIVYPRNPRNNEDLPNEIPYPIIGAFGDGNPDRIPWAVKVDGVQDDPGGYVVHVEINGFSDEPKPLEEGQPIDGEGNVWTVEGELDVTFDAQQGQEIEVKVRVELPEGGESEWDEKARLGEFKLKFESRIVVESAEAQVVLTESIVKAEVDLPFDPSPDDFPVQSLLLYEAFKIEVSDACGQAVAQTFPGTLQVLGGDFRIEDGQLATPQEVRIFIPPTIRETVFLTCNGFTLNIPLIQFFAGFYSFHGGELCGAEAEYDEAAPEQGIVITGWTAGQGDVAARKIYNRSCTEDDVKFTEETTIELLYPPPAGS